VARASTPTPARDCGRSERKLPTLRPSKNGRWRALALLAVHLLIALHVAHWLAAGETLSPLEPSEAMELTKHDLVNAGAVFFGLTILSTLVLGRWFCGWACHLVALQDLCLWLLKRVGIRPRPLRSRLLAWVPALAALYMFAYPLAYRLWQGLEIGPPRVALTKEDFWATFPPWPVALATFAVCGFASVYVLGAKGFCTYGCPYGAIFGFVERFAPGRIRVTDACEGCGHCTATCTSNVIVHEEVRRFGMVVDAGCMKCLDCVSVCPKEALYFGFGAPAGARAKQSGQRSKAWTKWSEELLLAAFFLAAFLVYRGLYGLIPFLFALGLAGVLAFVFASAVRVLRARDATVLGRALKSAGRWTRAGLAFGLAAGVLALLTLHGALVQLHMRRSASAYAAVRAEREAFLADPRHELAGERAAAAERGLASARFVRRYGLFRSTETELERTWLALATGAGTEFEQALLDVPPDDAGYAAARFDLGRYRAARGDEAGAVTAFEQALAASPSASGYDLLARLHFQAGRVDETLSVFRTALERFPENADLWFNQGVVLGLVGKLPEAERAFERVLELAPERVDARENLAGLRASAGSVGPR
jgi:tetratricopeptide (TPR) repeat protein